MLSGVLNCSRMLAAESVVELVRNDRIPLDHHDPAIEVGPRRQEGRHRGADDGAAHDHHVGVISVLHPPDASR